MKQILIGVIRAYQRIAPAAVRDRCIFSESCSHFVLRATRERGFLAGLSALLLRMRRCRPGYVRLPPSPMYPDLKSPVYLADGAIVDATELAARLR